MTRKIAGAGLVLWLLAGRALGQDVQAGDVKPAETQPAEGQPAEKPAEAAVVPESPMSKLDGGTFGCISARLVGPALMSGRVGDIAVNPADHSEWYVAIASGGVWKTTNAGHTFSPIFDGYGSYSIGCVTLDPRNPSVVWVGTGENNSQRSVSWGDGVYVSRNGGQSFENVGLKESEHIGMIAVHPRKSDTVFAAAMGPLWKSGGERGLYRTTDGGKTWERVLHISDETGVSEVRFDPRDPQTMYATAYQRRRHVWTLVNGGPESGVYKSTDGGSNWRRIDNGLPGGDKGRPGIAISPANPDVLYCICNASEGGGIYRSTDRGETWHHRSSYMATSPQYYNELFCDPVEVDRLYSMDTYLQMSVDGGATWKSIEGGDKHVDNHALWIDPQNPRHMVAGCDGGVYETFDRGGHWRYFENLPVTQFYRVACDNATPFYNVYGGTQDNSTIGGPSRTTDVVGNGNENWFVVIGGDGFEPAIDPEDPNIVYGQLQHGVLVRYDRNSGESVSIQPQHKPGEAPYVFNWDSPLLISPHKKERLYFAGDRLFRSDDRGNSWRAVSGDLTRGIDRNTLPVMGKIQKPEAVDKHFSTSIYGNCVSLTESPVREGLIYVGADDGLISITEDGGANWRKVEKVEGVPDLTYVSDLEASRHDENVVYAAFNGHKNGDFKQYLFRSADKGVTWVSIAGDLPANNVCHSIVEDHKLPNLLFVGTEYGAYYTLDGGKKWIKIGGLPTIAVRDIDVQRREDDLVLGTFGRGIYIVDDYSALRAASDELLLKPAAFFPIKPAMSFPTRSRLGYGGRGWSGATYWTAPNPAYGATFTFHIKDKTPTLRELRNERLDKPDWTYPTMDEFRAERNELEPEFFLTVRDSAGEIVRRLGAPRGPGIHEVTWDLRRVSTTGTDGSLGGPAGHPVPPGRYTVTLSRIKNATAEDLAGPEPFEVVAVALNPNAASDDQWAAKEEFRRKVEELQRAMNASARVLGELETKVGTIRRAVTQTPGASLELLGRADGLRNRLRGVREAFYGDPEFDRRLEPEAPSLFGRVGFAAGGVSESTEPVTAAAKEQYEFAAAGFEPQLAELRALEAEVGALATEVDRAGAPWTGGGLPEWRR
jgi:photosystem II stability/assembly factor-like uncharacterized protein